MKNDQQHTKQTEKFNLPVEGMTCASCVNRVEKAINKIDGVTNVSVNLATEKVSFELEPAKTDIKSIIDVVEDAGYKIKIDIHDYTNKKMNEYSLGNDYSVKLEKDFKFSLIFTIPVFLISMLMEISFFSSIHPFFNGYNK